MIEGQMEICLCSVSAAAEFGALGGLLSDCSVVG